MPWKTYSVAATLLLPLGVHAYAQEATRVIVELGPGTNRQTFEDRIEGYQTFDYIVPAEAGQSLAVAFRSHPMGAYINIYPPGSDTPMHIGGNRGNRFEGILPETGDYRVHAFLMENAAHREEIAEFTIEFVLGGGDPPSRDPDYADGLSGGPDFWVVTGVGQGEKLSVHAKPSTSGEVVDRVDEGTRLRNLGCRMEVGSRWCRVETVTGASTKLEGWVAGRYLAERAVPTTGASPGTGTEVRISDDPKAPELLVRASGEIEVSFRSGCGALYGADGTRITAGASCSAEQLHEAAEAVKAYQR